MEPVVHLRAAVSLLGRFPALAGVDLDIGRGETVVLQGPNGAGKTTLLRLCAGLAPVASGTARVLGHDLTRDRKGVRRHVGLLGHQTHLYDELTVADNVTFWAKAVRADAQDAQRAMARLGLDGRLAAVPVARLSAGQRRRTALAVLVARRPELWLLDEPHAGLDQDGRDLLDGLIRDATAAGATVVMASHELERVRGLAPRVVHIAGGAVAADEPAPSPEGPAERSGGPAAAGPAAVTGEASGAA